MLLLLKLVMDGPFCVLVWADVIANRVMPDSLLQRSLVPFTRSGDFRAVAVLSPLRGPVERVSYIGEAAIV